METVIGVGIPIIVMLVMFIFGLYSRRNIGWVMLCLIWGSISYGLFILLNPKLLEMGLSKEAINIAFTPLIQQGLISLGVFFVIYREKFDNLVDGTNNGFHNIPHQHEVRQILLFQVFSQFQHLLQYLCQLPQNFH